MNPSPDKLIVRDGRDPEQELVSLQKRFAAITRGFEQAARWRHFVRRLRVDALAACALFLVAFAVMVLSPPMDSVKHVLVSATETWLSSRKSLPETAPPQSYWRDEPQAEEPVVQGGVAEVHYRNCAAAYAAGAAPIHIGEPGYEPRMDGDNDGIACEPLRRRR